MRRTFLLAAAALVLVLPATAHAAPPVCDDHVEEDLLVTPPGSPVRVDAPCGQGNYTLDIVDPPAGGLFAASGTTLTYTPDGDFQGFDTFTYQATNGDGPSNVARIDVLVDTAPACVDAQAMVVAGRSVRLTGNPCADADGDSVTLVLDTGPAHGSLELDATGTPVYTPDEGFTGTDTLGFHGEDDFLLASDVATLTITVVPAPVTPAPLPLPAPPPPPARDLTAPAAALSSPAGQKLKQVLAKGLRLMLTSNEAGRATVTVSVDAKTARKLHIQPEVGRATAAVGAGKLELTVKLGAKARKALKKLSKVRLSVQAVVTDAAGNASLRSLTVTLKR